jgi:hypothetical protein
MGWHVGPLPRNGVSENIDADQVVLDGHVGMVGMTPSGHRRVDTSAVGGRVHQEKCGVDGASLAGVAGLRISELDMSDHVVGGECDGSGPSGDGDRPVVVDLLDSPVVPILDHQTLAGAECPVVATGHHLVAVVQDLVLGLRWDSVDLGACTITVQRTRVRVHDGVAEGPPKTNRGRRAIDLDDRTVDALVSWAALQIEERVAWGSAYQDGGWVFTWEDGRPLEPTGISSRFARRLKDAGVPKIRLHDLRDTHATLLLKEGVPPHVVSQRLGHSSIAFTLQVYAHVLPGQQSEAAERVAALVDGND